MPCEERLARSETELDHSIEPVVNRIERTAPETRKLNRVALRGDDGWRIRRWLARTRTGEKCGGKDEMSHEVSFMRKMVPGVAAAQHPTFPLLVDS